MKIAVGAEDLFELLGPGAKISIPSFQRNYAWGKDSLDQFIEDIFYSVEHNEQHFFGPIVVLNQKKDEYQIIDGQQRITTAIMTLSIARDCLYDQTLFDSKTMVDGAHQVDLEMPFKQSLFNGKYLHQPKFTANAFLEKIFSERVLPAPDDNRPNVDKKSEGLTPTEKQTSKEFRNAYIYVKEKITEYLRNVHVDNRKSVLSDLHTSLTKGFQILSLVLSEEEDAYELFENLNHRGVKLAPNDLLKTLTLRDIRAQGEVAFNKALDVWDDIVLVQLNSTSEFTQFLRYYLLTQLDKPIQASRIYPEFKEIIKNSGVGGAQANLNSLAKSSIHYSKLIGVTPHELDELRNAFLRLNIIGQTHKVLLLRAMQSNVSENQLLKLTRAVEMLSFRWIANGQNAQILENHFRQYGHKINIGITDEAINAICEELVMLAPNDLSLADIHNTGSEYLARYALQAIESKLGAGYFTWENPTTLEHIAPRNPGTNSDHWHNALKVSERALEHELTEDIEYANTVHTWGNLSLLEFTLNSTIKNSQWVPKRDGIRPEKDKCLKTSGFTINTPLKSLDAWTINRIEDRGIWMRDTILKLRSSAWVQSGNVTISNWNPS